MPYARNLIKPFLLLNTWVRNCAIMWLHFLLQDPNSITVVGPLWTGPLHDTTFLTEMLSLATEWGWANTIENGVSLEKLLDTMIEESDSRLPPGYIRLDEVYFAVPY